MTRAIRILFSLLCRRITRFRAWLLWISEAGAGGRRVPAPDWIEDLGYTSEQLDEVERICEARLQPFEGTEQYDAKFERCEAMEKSRINPDPFS
jgi:hypothetical protein